MATNIVQADGLADLMARGRELLRQEQRRQEDEEIARQTAQEHRDRQHWRACRSAVCQDLPPFLIHHSNLTADPPEGWTGGLEPDGQQATREFVLRLQCPDCVEVRRIYTTAGPTPWRSAAPWAVPTHELYTQDNGRMEVRRASYPLWRRFECLAMALAWAQEYREGDYCFLLEQRDEANGAIERQQADAPLEVAPIQTTAEILYDAICRVVSEMMEDRKS